MSILLAFAPFIAFAAADRLIGSVEGLFAGFAVSAVLLLRDWLSLELLSKITGDWNGGPVRRAGTLHAAGAPSLVHHGREAGG